MSPAHRFNRVGNFLCRTAAFAFFAAAVAIAADTDRAAHAKRAADAAPNPYEQTHAAPAPNGAIDDAVFRRWQELGIEPARVCSDAVFIRRAFLDLIGTLPTAAEVQAFVRDPARDKRAVSIDALLRREEFADYWAMKWSDVLRVKAEFPINLWPNAAQAYHRWIRTAARDNLPYDRFARALLTSSGSNFRVGPVNFYRATQARDPASLARAVALTFMGERAEKWPPDRLAAMAAFFSRLGYKPTGEWKEEIVFFDPEKSTAGFQPARNTGGRPERGGTFVFPDGQSTSIAPHRDPREAFADWLIAPSNPWFTRAIANRVWFWLLGRGIVHEPDDFRPDNPPSNPELLAALERELLAANFDLRELIRAIANSTTYQLSSLARSEHPAAEASFAFYAPRRLEAEVLIDALNQITGSAENYTSAIPEPFTFVPADLRSIALPDGSITSSFLEAFGRPARDTGLALERNDRITASQRLHLLNSSHVRNKIERGARMQALVRSRRAPGDALGALYLSILSRPPTREERLAIAEYAKANALTPTATAQDVAWALINSAEFLYRH